MTATDPWDIIIHHAGVDTSDAERLYDVLSGRCRVFLDSRSTKVGEAWDFEASRALGAARISVVILSRRTQTPDAPAHRSDRHFADLVGEAVRWNRRQPRAHRVIPVAMDFRAAEVERMPFGLSARQLIQAEDLPDLEAVADRILAPPGAGSGGAPPATPGSQGATRSALFKPKFGARQRALIVMAVLGLIVLGLVAVVLFGLLFGDDPGASSRPGADPREALSRGEGTPPTPKAQPAPRVAKAVKPATPQPRPAAPLPKAQPRRAVPASPRPAPPAPAPEPVKSSLASAPESVKAPPAPAPEPAAGGSEADYFSVHVLKDGENLWKLAHDTYKVDYWLVQDYNKDKDFRRLRPGSKIRIPKTKKRYHEIKALLAK
jgi:hypothetical protein